MAHAAPLFGYPRPADDWQGVAPFLPMSRKEMSTLGWTRCDVILVTGDAYVDHPSFGMALIGRLLEAQGFRVGIISQPDWHGPEAFRALGRPALFFGVTAGNMDSMVNRYTADQKIRSDDAYTPGAAAGRRPPRSTIVYAQRCREAFPGVPVVLGGIEASLRRVAHYDFWSDQVRRSILFDAKADLVLFGNAERAVVALAHRLDAGEPVATVHDLRGTACSLPRGEGPLGATPGPSAERGCASATAVVRLPSWEEVRDDPVRFAQASRLLHLESNPHNARPLAQAHGDRDLWLNPPPLPLTTAELDQVYELPYQRRPHPSYGTRHITAYDMIRFSVTIMRGCFGGCTFCSLTEHEGRLVQSRSAASVRRELETIRDQTPGFTGTISDLGGPTANLYRMGCRDPEVEAACRRLSCLYPEVCPRLSHDHGPLVRLYRQARRVPGITRVLVSSGVRHDLALAAPDYLRELVTHHVGGHLKVAPEHVGPHTLALMMKPGIDRYERFMALFRQRSRAAGKRQYLVPYFLAAHPGTSDEEMIALALWLRRHRLRVDQVQTFLPTPMSLATTMYHTRRNPLRRVTATSPEVVVTTGARARRLHKAFLRYHDPESWPLLRRALRERGREDLIGTGPQHLVPPAPGTRQPPPPGGRQRSRARPQQPPARARQGRRPRGRRPRRG